MVTRYRMVQALMLFYKGLRCTLMQVRRLGGAASERPRLHLRRRNQRDAGPEQQIQARLCPSLRIPLSSPFVHLTGMQYLTVPDQGSWAREQYGLWPTMFSSLIIRGMHIPLLCLRRAYRHRAHILTITSWLSRSSNGHCAYERPVNATVSDSSHRSS